MSYYYFLQPLKDIHLKSHLRYDAANNGSLNRVKIFSIIGVIVLLLACINYINLTTERGFLSCSSNLMIKQLVQLIIVRIDFLVSQSGCSSLITKKESQVVLF